MRLLVERARTSTGNDWYRLLYQEIDFDGIDPVDARQSIPMITKDDLVADQAGRRVIAEGHALARLYYSAGPFVCALTDADVASYDRSYATALRSAGVRMGDIVDVTVSYHWSQGCAVDGGLRTLGCAVVPGGVGMSETHIEVIRRVGVNVLFTFPSFAWKLAETAEAMGIEPASLDIRLLVIAGEQHHDEADRLSAAFGGAAIGEVYGTSDLALVAASCGRGPGLHIQPGYVVEVMEPGTSSPAEPGAGGELVVTEIFKQAQPIVRLRTGDVVDRVHLDACACGNTAPRIGRVIGRTSTTIKIKGQLVAPAQLQRALAEMHGLSGTVRMTIDRPSIQDRLSLEVERDSTGAHVDAHAVSQRSATVMRIRPDTIHLVDAGTLQPGATIDDRRTFAAE